MTDRNGEMVQHYGYQPFGSERYRNNTSAFSVSNRYTGQILDEDTGLYYYGARYYDPEVARFVQADSTVPDPEFSQAYNRYAYVYNNPLNFTDPTGQNPFAIVLFVIGTTEITVGTVVVAGCISAGLTALAGGNPLQGFALGVAGAMFAGLFGVVANNAFIGAVASGALTSVMSGGDPLMGALTAGISAGVCAAFADVPLPSVVGDLGGEFLEGLILSTASGALAGGVTAEISGGEFGEGAAHGAAGAAANYVVSAKIGDHVEEEAVASSGAGAMPGAMGMIARAMDMAVLGAAPVPDAMTYSTSDEGLYMTALFQEKGSITFIAQKPRASLLKSLLDKGGKQAFKSFRAFKRYYGSAGDKMHWHHIVEKTGKNIFNFGKGKIHNANNIVKIPAKIHSKISAHYASRLRWMPKGMTVRSWLSKFPMEVQYKYGVQIMRKYGVGM